MKIGILHEGDRVITVTNDFLAVERASGEVDIVPIIRDNEVFRIDTEHIVTIGYGENIVQIELENGIKITKF